MAIADILSQFKQNPDAFMGSVGKNLNAPSKTPKGVIQPPKPKTGVGGFIQRNLPAIAGTGGAIVGGALAPETGGLSLLAIPALGAAIGQAGGEAAKEYGTNATVNAGNVAKQGAVGGASELAGAGVAKLGGKLLGGVASKAGSASEKMAANNLFANVPKKVQIANKAATTSKQLANYGLSADNLPNAIAKTTYGENPVLSNAVRRSYEAAGPVDLRGIDRHASDIADSLDVTTPGSGTAFRKMFENNINRATDSNPISFARTATAKRVETQIPTNSLNKVPASSVFDFKRNLEKAAFAAGTKPDQKNAFMGLANELDSRLQKAGADKAVAKGTVFSPEELQTLNEISPKLAQEAQSATTAGGLRSLMAPFAKAHSLLNEADKQNEVVGSGGLSGLDKLLGIGGVGGALFTHGASIPAALAVKGASKAVASAPGRRALGGVLNVLGKGGENRAPGTITKLLAPGIKTALAEPTVQNIASPQPQSSSTADTSALSSLPTQDQSQTDQGSSSAFTPEALQALAIHDIQTTGGKNLDKISQLDNLFGPKSKGSNAASQKNVSDIQDAFSYLDTAEQELADLGGAQGPKAEAAKIPLVGKYVEPKVFAYNKTRVDLATALAKSLTGSARPAASVINRFEESLPGPTDSPEAASQKLKNLRTELGQKALNYGLDTSGSNPVQ